VFDVPYAPPADKPIITSTATDPLGNTSAISRQRTADLRAPKHKVRLLPGQSGILSTSSGDAIVLRQASAGPFDPEWGMTLSGSAGTLTLSGTDGLVGSGDGTGTLDYRGTLGALNAALEGLIYAPPAGYQGFTTLSVNAQSYEVTPLQAAVPIVVTDGTFLVT